MLFGSWESHWPFEHLHSCPTLCNAADIVGLAGWRRELASVRYSDAHLGVAGRVWPCLMDGKLMFLVIYCEALETSIYCFLFPCLGLGVDGVALLDTDF